MRKIKIPDNPIAFCQEGTQLVREHGYIWINSTQDVQKKTLRPPTIRQTPRLWDFRNDTRANSAFENRSCEAVSHES